MECAPYVLVLADVPILRNNTDEPYVDLLNKVRGWLDTFIEGPLHPANDVIMVRRVPWIGNGVKKKPGDCVIVNFRSPVTNNYVFTRFYAQSVSLTGIIPLPLGYFYQQATPLMANCISKFRTQPFLSLPLQNRFHALANLDEND